MQPGRNLSRRRGGIGGGGDRAADDEYGRAGRERIARSHHALLVGPMIACTSPAGTTRSMPRRIGLSATVAWRFSMFSIVIF